MNTTLDLSELNEKIGRLFMTGIPGLDLDGDTILLIRDYGIAGIILFARNINNPVQLTKLCLDIQEASMKYHATPMFIAVPLTIFIALSRFLVLRSSIFC